MNERLCQCHRIDTSSQEWNVKPVKGRQKKENMEWSNINDDTESEGCSLASYLDIWIVWRCIGNVECEYIYRLGIL